SVADAVAALAAAGVRAEPVDGAPDAVHVLEGTPAAALDVVPAIVQDPAAGLVARYVAPPPGTRLLDLCAAPGGKAIALADAGANVVAIDVSADRVKRLTANLRRLPP